MGESSKVRIATFDGQRFRMIFCPGCGCSHRMDDTWGFNDNFQSPTFTPSLLVRSADQDTGERLICHSFITNGKIQFLTDSTHKLAGQEVDLEVF